MLATLSLSLPTPWVPTPSSSSQSACSAGGRTHQGGGRQLHRKLGSRPQKHSARSFDVKVWKLKIQSRSARGRCTGAIPTAKEPVRGNEVRVPVTLEVLGQGELCAALAFTALPLGALGWKGQFSCLQGVIPRTSLQDAQRLQGRPSSRAPSRNDLG